MRDEDSDWFSKWEEDLPSPEELTPLSQTLISPHLALAFDIQTPNSHHHPPTRPRGGSGDLDSSSGAGSDDTARTLKRPRLVWTPQLHKRFVDAVAHLGIKNAVPKTIMQLMSVDGLTRENVASHLQKYRLYLKRMQGVSNGGGVGDPATDHLFASSPVPAQLLVGGGRSREQLMGHVHRQQVAAMVAGGQYGHQRQMGHFGSPVSGSNGGFMLRQAQVGVHGMVQSSGAGFEDGELGASKNGRKVLTLFPSADD